MNKNLFHVLFTLIDRLSMLILVLVLILSSLITEFTLASPAEIISCAQSFKVQKRNLNNQVIASPKYNDWDSIIKYFDAVIKSKKASMDIVSYQMNSNSKHPTYLNIMRNLEVYKEYGFVSNKFEIDKTLKNPSSLREFIEKYHLHLEGLTSSGAFFEDDLIYIGFLLINNTGELKVIKYGSSIPPGYYLYIKKSDKPFYGSILWRSISNGIFPLDPDLVLHDLSGHIISYRISPSFGKHYRNLLSDILNTTDEIPMNINKYLLRQESQQHDQRVYFFNEYLFLINKTRLFKFLREIDLNLSEEESNEIIGLKIINHLNRRLNVAENNAVLEKLEEEFFDFYIPFGGVINGLDYVAATSLFQRFFIKASKPERYQLLPYFLKVLVYLSDITFEDWYLLTRSPTLSKDNKVYSILCNQLFSSKYPWFRQNILSLYLLRPNIYFDGKCE